MIVAVVAFAAVSGAPATRRADKIERVPKSASEALGYVAFLPPSYSTDADKPTIIYLHGLGERGNGSASDLNIPLTAGFPRLAATTNTLPDDASQLLILAPQTDDEYFDPDKLHIWLAHVLQSYRMDRTRLYLTGISMGGQGVFDYLAKYGAEQEFAAAVPISGNYLPLPLEVPPCDRLSGTPLWAFVGERDDVIPPQGSIQVVSYVNKALPSCRGSAIDDLLGQFPQRVGSDLRPQRHRAIHRRPVGRQRPVDIFVVPPASR